MFHTALRCRFSEVWPRSQDHSGGGPGTGQSVPVNSTWAWRPHQPQPPEKLQEPTRPTVSCRHSWSPCSPLKPFLCRVAPGAHGCWALHVSALLVGRGRPWGPRGDPAPAGWPMGMWAEASVALGSSGRNTAEERSAGLLLAGLLARVWPRGALPSLSPAPHLGKGTGLPPSLGYLGCRETKQLDRLCWGAAGGPCVPPPAARSLLGGWLGALLPAVTAGPSVTGLATWLLASFCHNRASPGR